MVKRKAAVEEAAASGHPHKRRYARPDFLSSLTDELLLRVLGHVSTYTLTVCQRVNRRLQLVAGDSQLWKAAYYDRFVRPRAQRLPGHRDQPRDSRYLSHSSKLSKWLDESILVRRGQEVDWKRQYRLRHNWTRGSCGISEISVTDQAPPPPLLARLCDGIIYTVDVEYGLRAFSVKQGQQMLGSEGKQDHYGALSTALAVDTQNHNESGQRLAVGFDDGAFAIHSFDRVANKFALLYKHAASSMGMISSMAFSWPFLLTMSHAQTLSLYRFSSEGREANNPLGIPAPLLLTSLKSQSIWPPLSLALRLMPGSIVASVAYSIPTFSSGWTAGIQELRLAVDGSIKDSRIATAVSQMFEPLSRPRMVDEADETTKVTLGNAAYSRPTSLSYTHPYLLCCHADNTLTLYLVKSSHQGLSMSPGKRLWGHTSSVFGAHVGGRGRAVSVTTQGEEVRVWELEGSTLISTSKARLSRSAETSVPVMPEKSAADGPDDGPADTTAATTKGWVGFDEENVIVLRQKTSGEQKLAVYDFS